VSGRPLGIALDFHSMSQKRLANEAFGARAGGPQRNEKNLIASDRPVTSRNEDPSAISVPRLRTEVSVDQRYESGPFGERRSTISLRDFPSRSTPPPPKVAPRCCRRRRPGPRARTAIGHEIFHWAKSMRTSSRRRFLRSATVALDRTTSKRWASRRPLLDDPDVVSAWQQGKSHRKSADRQSSAAGTGLGEADRDSRTALAGTFPCIRGRPREFPRPQGMKTDAVSFPLRASGKSSGNVSWEAAALPAMGLVNNPMTSSTASTGRRQVIPGGDRGRLHTPADPRAAAGHAVGRLPSDI